MRVENAAIRIEALEPGSDEMLSAIISLGDRHRDHLGQLPHAVYREAAEQERLLVAVPRSGGRPVGYALFRLPRNEVALTHLCVDDEVRSQGVAKALVQAISTRHDARLGIRAKCRDDYGLDGAWRAFGFAPRARAFGRGRDRAPMTVWWKDHGHPDLFTEFESPVDLRAAIDLNIVRDLDEPEKRKHRSDFLIADDLVGRLQLVVTSGMSQEIGRAEAAQRASLMAAIKDYPLVNADPITAERIRVAIVTALQERLPTYPTTAQDDGDLLQVAHAAAAGTSVFLTWDDRLANTLGPIVERLTSMKIMAPDYVVSHLDELANADSFPNQSLEGSELERFPAGYEFEWELDAFVARAAGERRNELRDLLRQLVRGNHERRCIRLADGTPVALYAVERNDGVFRVPLLRLADHKIADLLARHLLWSLRRQARAEGAKLIDISEPKMSTRLVQAADFESMVHADGHWYTPIVDVCGTSGEVAATAATALRSAGLSAPPLIAPGLSPHAAARLEQAWWPAKITDSELPCYVVLIKVHYASELFGYPVGLTARDTQLALGREHVYYHSARSSKLTAPARVLWWATGKGPGTGHFFGVSKLDDLMVDTPERLYGMLSYYGVFEENAVVKAANGQPKAEALRLSNTELFDHPVSERRYHRLRDLHKTGPAAFYGVQHMPAELFAAIYNEGTRSGTNP